MRFALFFLSTLSLLPTAAYSSYPALNFYAFTLLLLRSCTPPGWHG